MSKTQTKRRQQKPVLVTAFNSTRKDLKIIFFMAFFLVLLIEMVLKNFEAPSQTFYRFGNIMLKLSYSIVASSIFLFINQQIPKEQKKLKTFIYLQYKVAMLTYELQGIATVLELKNGGNNGNDPEITNDAILSAMKKLDPDAPLTSTLYVYKNWSSFILDLKDRATSTIDALLPLHDIIDADLLENLYHIQNQFYTWSLIQNTNPNDLESSHHHIYAIFKLAETSMKLLNTKYKDTLDQSIARNRVILKF